MSGSRAVTIACGVGGGASLVAQFALSRAAIASLSGNELGVGLLLGSWLLFGGLGSMLFSSATRGDGRSPNAFLGLLFALGILGPASCYWVVLARKLLFGFEFSPSLWQTAVVAAGGTLPISMVAGALFAAANQAASTAAEAAHPPNVTHGSARPLSLYCADATGSFAGGLLASILLAPFLATLRLALVASSILFLTAGVLSLKLQSRAVLPAVALACCVIAGAAAAIHGAFGAMDLALARLQFAQGEIVARSDSPYQSLTAVRSRESVSIYQDGALTYFSQGGEREQELAHIPLLSAERVAHVLVVGNGWPLLSREILKQPVKQLEVIVLDQKTQRAGSEILPTDQAAILGDSRLRFRYGDAGEILNEAPGSYDAIFLDAGVPDTLLAARLYSREFLLHLRDSLAPGGVVVLDAPALEGALSQALALLNASLLVTARDVFGRAVVLQGEYAGNIIVAGNDVSLDQFQPARLSAVLARRNVKASWISPSSLETMLDPGRLAALNQKLDKATAPASTLDEPVVLRYSLRYREERSGSLISSAFPSSLSLGQIVLVLVAVAVLLLFFRRARGSSLLAAGYAAALGFTGMVAELTLLAAFQLSSGSLYQSIAGLVGLFMAGLAAGSALGLQVRRGARVQPRAPARCFGHRAGGPPVGRSPAILPAAAMSTGLLIALIGALFGRRILSAPPILFLLCVSIAMTLAGASCGAGVSFVLSDTSHASAQRKSLGWGGLVYGADLFGGALGGLLASGLAIPFLGIARSFWLAVLGYGMSLLLLAAQKIGARSPA